MELCRAVQQEVTYFSPVAPVPLCLRSSNQKNFFANPSAVAATRAYMSKRFAPVKNLSCGHERQRRVPFDDEDQNYIVYPGHLIGKYQLQEVLGKGSFGVVVRAYDTQLKQFVAIKIVNSKPAFTKMAKSEITYLLSLKSAENKDSFVQILDYFLYRGHVCIVTELLATSLYDFLASRSFKGLSLDWVRQIAQQLFTALQHLSSSQLRLIHCDLKPENIMLRNLNEPAIKVIDLGSACRQNETAFTYLQSRYYRAPEVLAGLPYDESIDMWSVGCILAELFTGAPLFEGHDEADQMERIAEVCGLPSEDMLRRGTKYKYLILQGKDRGYQTPGSKSLSSIIRAAAANSNSSISTHELNSFIDLLQTILTMDASDRISPSEALAHPFIAHFCSTLSLPQMDFYNLSLRDADLTAAIPSTTFYPTLAYPIQSTEAPRMSWSCANDQVLDLYQAICEQDNHVVHC